MPAQEYETGRREKAALAAIHNAFGTAADEYGATLFVAHHLEELEASYWQSHLGTTNPEAERVLGLLVLRSHWGGDGEGNNTFDFTLPGDVTDYVISVRFDEAGSVAGISMES